MKFRTLIAGAAVVLLCSGVGVCVAEEAGTPPVAPSPAAEATPAAKPKHHAKHHRRHHHGKHHGATKEFTEQELQAQSPSK
jgi:hypothetical protein